MTITDKYSIEDKMDGLFYFGIEGDDAPPWRLPEEIADHMPNKPRRLGYRTKEDGMANLAEGCLAWAQSQAEENRAIQPSAKVWHIDVDGREYLCEANDTATVHPPEADTPVITSLEV